MASKLESALADLLSGRGIHPTSQRMEIARVLFDEPAHRSADEVFAEVNRAGSLASKATVYNTLGLFAERGLIREVIIDPHRVVYDPNVEPHHHFYNTVTGELIDIDASTMAVNGLPPVPEGTQVEGIEVIIRVRPETQPS